MMPEEEAYGCNTIGLANGKVLVAEGYPAVKKFLEERGLDVVEIDMSQIRAKRWFFDLHVRIFSDAY